MGDGYSRGPLPWMGSETKIGTCPTCGAPTKGDMYRNEALLERDAENSRLRAREKRLVAVLEEVVAAWDNDGRSEPSAAHYEYAVGLARAALNEVKGGGDDG